MKEEGKFCSVKFINRGQAWGFDLTIGGTIFVGAMVVFYFYTLNFSSGEGITANLDYEARILSDSLLSEGYPENWDENNVIEIGILSDGRVDEAKLRNFYDLAESNYQQSKNLFNIEHNYYVYFDEPIDFNGTEIDGIGLRETNENNLVKISRIVIRDGAVKEMNIHVWN